MNDVIQYIQNEEGEDITENSLGVDTTPCGGGGNWNLLTGASIAGARIRTPRNPKLSGTTRSSQFSELMQFIKMRSESKSRHEQQCHQKCKELKDRCQCEREETEDKNHYDCQESEERHEQRLERQLQMQSVMMQMFIMSMMGRNIKRKKDH